MNDVITASTTMSALDAVGFTGCGLIIFALAIIGGIIVHNRGRRR